MGCVVFSVIVAITPCERLHQILHNSFVAIKYRNRIVCISLHFHNRLHSPIPPPLSVPTTQPAVKNDKIAFAGPYHLPKFWDKKPKATSKFTPPKKVSFSVSLSATMNRPFNTKDYLYVLLAVKKPRRFGRRLGVEP